MKYSYLQSSAWSWYHRKFIEEQYLPKNEAFKCMARGTYAYAKWGWLVTKMQLFHLSCVKRKSLMGIEDAASIPLLNIRFISPLAYVFEENTNELVVEIWFQFPKSAEFTCVNLIKRCWQFSFQFIQSKPQFHHTFSTGYITVGVNTNDLVIEI